MPVASYQHWYELISLPYEDYLKTAHWSCVRSRALEKAEHRCEICSRKENLEVHHKSYEHIGREQPEDLQVLCADCHDRTHFGWTQLQFSFLYGDIPPGRQNDKRYGEIVKTHKYGIGTVKHIWDIKDRQGKDRLRVEIEFVFVGIKYLYWDEAYLDEVIRESIKP